MHWTELPQGGCRPLQRSSHTLTACDGKVYLFGGEHEPRKPIDSQIHRYDLNSGVWELLQTNGTPPTPRVATSAAAVGGKIYYFGGRSGVDMAEGPLNDLHVFDTASAAWRAVGARGTPPTPRSFHASAVVGSRMFVFGGCGAAGRLNDLWVFDTDAETWEQMPSSPAVVGRGGPGLAALPDGSLYVVGGFCGHELGDVHRFDAAAQRWDCPSCCGETGAEGENPLPPRSVFGLSLHACGSCAHDSHLVLFGGEVTPSDKGHAGAGNFTNAALSFDAAKPELGWRPLAADGAVPSPRGWFASAAVSDGILVHGGNSPSNERLGDLHLLHLH
ncbi:hypothetical protein WJX81_004489 [Elliptochloris bilobata]|uniref:Galactose oxidase n=1 Tax=Elliptochloris bilobata TaxID=381761 RepID=A0AAW1QX63_9CHLO